MPLAFASAWRSRCRCGVSPTKLRSETVRHALHALSPKTKIRKEPQSPAACDRSSASSLYAIGVADSPALIPLQCSQDSTRRVHAPAPLTRIEGEAVVEVNGQALHAAFDVRAGSPTDDTDGADGGVGPLLLGVNGPLWNRHTRA